VAAGPEGILSRVQIFLPKPLQVCADKALFRVMPR
jgi:hypothetical protein